MKTFVILSLFVALAAAAPVGEEEPIAIISQNSDANADGSYVFSYETANGIRAEQNGEVRPNPNPLAKDAGGSENIIVSRGSFSYTAPDGTPITLTYIADENGFQPQGDHLPVAPPIPEAIQRSLDLIASQQQKRK